MKNIQIFRRVLGAAFVFGLLFATSACGDAADGSSTSSYCAYDDLESVKECLSLTEFHQATNGDGWKDSTGWLTRTDHCDWHGVTCDDAGHVERLDFKFNELSGTSGIHR